MLYFILLEVFNFLFVYLIFLYRLFKVELQLGIGYIFKFLFVGFVVFLVFFSYRFSLGLIDRGEGCCFWGIVFLLEVEEVVGKVLDFCVMFCFFSVRDFVVDEFIIKGNEGLY